VIQNEHCSSQYRITNGDRLVISIAPTNWSVPNWIDPFFYWFRYLNKSITVYFNLQWTYILSSQCIYTYQHCICWIGYWVMLQLLIGLLIILETFLFSFKCTYGLYVCSFVYGSRRILYEKDIRVHCWLADDVDVWTVDRHVDISTIMNRKTHVKISHKFRVFATAVK
jgi:hypothetical protein